MTNNYLYVIEKNNNEFVSNEYSDTIKYLDGVLTEEGIEQVIAQNKKVKKAVIVFSMDILNLNLPSPIQKLHNLSLINRFYFYFIFFIFYVSMGFFSGLFFYGGVVVLFCKGFFLFLFSNLT